MYSSYQRLGLTANGNSHSIWNHTVLPATRQRWDSRLYLQPKQVLDITTPEGMQGWLDYILRQSGPAGNWTRNLSAQVQRPTVEPSCNISWWRGWRQSLKFERWPVDWGFGPQRSLYSERSNATSYVESLFYGWKTCIWSMRPEFSNAVTLHETNLITATYMTILEHPNIRA